MVSQPKEVRVLMVCLGICRSPMAEAVLKHQIAQRPSLAGKFDMSVDSAGTGAYHEGDEADERTIATCKIHKVPISCTARPVRKSDYAEFDYILAMDNSNLQTLLHRRPAECHPHIALFGSFDPALTPDKKPQAITDPYYGGTSGFERCYEQCVVFAKGFLDAVESEMKRRKSEERENEDIRDAMGM